MQNTPPRRDGLAYDAQAFRMIAQKPAGTFGFKPEDIALMLLCAVDEAERLRAEVARLDPVNPNATAEKRTPRRR